MRLNLQIHSRKVESYGLHWREEERLLAELYALRENSFPKMFS